MYSSPMQWPWFAIAFALYPLLHIAAANPGQVEAPSLALVAGATLVIAAVLLLLLRAALGSWLRAALGVAVEDIDLVMPKENFFGVNFGTTTQLRFGLHLRSDRGDLVEPRVHRVGVELRAIAPLGLRAHRGRVLTRLTGGRERLFSGLAARRQCLRAPGDDRAGAAGLARARAARLRAPRRARQR